jgi:hypothetical protein
MQTSVSIAFVNVNATKCLCPRCPVQLSSNCVNGKITKLKENLNKHPLIREDIPGVYCATGTATCTDIKTEHDCVCGRCVVFPEYKLINFQPMGHYCRNGSAK